MVLVRDGKRREFARRRAILTGAVRNAAAHGIRDGILKSGDFARIAFGHHLDTAVREILYKSRDGKRTSDLAGGISKPHALNAPREIDGTTDVW